MPFCAERRSTNFCTSASGTTLSFVDYVKEFPYFRDTVLPILEARGLRKPGGSKNAN